AKIVSKNSSIKVLNNGGKTTYEFTKNGKFTFHYEDVYGNQKEIDATVTWIDKEAPVASIQYNTTSKGPGPVIATLIPNGEAITITNNNGQETYTFTKNGTFEFIYQDAAGNTNKTVANVNWIVSNTKNNSVVNIIKPTPSSAPINMDNEHQNAQVEYRTYSTTNVSLRLPTGTVKEADVLKENRLILNETLKKRVGEDSPYFEVYFENKQTGKETLDSTEVEMIFKIDPNKKLLAIYEVGENDSLKSLNYHLVGNNQAVIDTTGLKKYILSYEEKNTTQPIESNENQNQSPISSDLDSSKEEDLELEKGTLQFFDNIHFWIIGGVSVALIGFGIYLLSRKNDSKETFLEPECI
ncbi:MAG: hypothetical protein K2I72_02175, partial [Bacilli bacterium]|nr:hypothetical protein [Bacilli bacterium]